MTRLVTANARTTSGLALFDHVTGSSPERRARYAEVGEKIAAERKAKLRADILLMRENICELVKPETAQRMREEWALQDRVMIVDVEDLGPGRIAA